MFSLVQLVHNSYFSSFYFNSPLRETTSGINLMVKRREESLFPLFSSFPRRVDI